MTPDQLTQLHQLCFDTPAPWSAAAFSQFLADDVCAFVTSENAFMLGRLIGDEAEVLTLAVAPVARRQGAALALMTRFHAQAAGRGVARIFWKFQPKIQPRLRFIKSLDTYKRAKDCVIISHLRALRLML